MFIGDVYATHNNDEESKVEEYRKNTQGQEWSEEEKVRGGTNKPDQIRKVWGSGFSAFAPRTLLEQESTHTTIGTYLGFYADL